MSCTNETIYWLLGIMNLIGWGSLYYVVYQQNHKEDTQ